MSANSAQAIKYEKRGGKSSAKRNARAALRDLGAAYPYLPFIIPAVIVLP